MVVHLVLLDLTQGLGAGADDLEFATVEIKHVRAGVELAKVTVDVERMEICGACESLGGHGLDDVAGDDVLLEDGDEALVALLADVGHSLTAERDGGLGDLWRDRSKEDPCEATDLGDGGLVDKGEICCAGIVEDVGDDLDVLEEMVVDEEGVGEHEEGLGDAEGVGERAGGLGLEVLDAVVRDVADGAAGEGGDLGDADVLVDGELALEHRHGVAWEVLARAGLDDLEGIWPVDEWGWRQRPGEGRTDAPAPMNE